MFPLLGSEKQTCVSVASDGHIVEIPRKFCAVFNHKIIEFIGRNRVVILTCVANRGAEKAFVLAKKLHCAENLFVGSLASSCVVRLLVTLNRERNCEIAAGLEAFAGLVVDKSSVCVGKEKAIPVFVCKGENIVLADEGLSAREHKEMRSELLALGYDFPHFVKRKVFPMAVFGSPTALTFKVAGRGGVKKNNPRDIDMLLIPLFSEGCGAD